MTGFRDKSHQSIHPVWHGLVSLAAIALGIYLPLRVQEDVLPEWDIRIYYWLLLLVLAADAVYNAIKARQLRREDPYSGQRGLNAVEIWWLFVDIIAAIPWGVITGLVALELLRVIKLARAVQYFSYWSQRFFRITDILRLGFFTFWILLVSHYLACGWMLLHPRPELDNLSRYIRSIYWSIQTLTTVGYGDVTTGDNPSMLFAIVIMFLGAGMYGYIIGNIATILAKKDPSKAQYFENLDNLRAFVLNRRMPISLQTKIRDYYKYLWQNRLGIKEEDFLETLPPGLREEVSLHLKKELLKNIPLFSRMNDDFINKVAQQLRPEIYTPGDIIVERGQEGEEMFVIIRGRLDVLGEKEGQVLSSLNDGDFFGEIALFENRPRTATIIAKTFCDLYRLDKKSFDIILQDYPGITEKLRETARKRMK